MLDFVEIPEEKQIKLKEAEFAKMVNNAWSSVSISEPINSPEKKTKFNFLTRMIHYVTERLSFYGGRGEIDLIKEEIKRTKLEVQEMLEDHLEARKKEVRLGHQKEVEAEIIKKRKRRISIMLENRDSSDPEVLILQIEKDIKQFFVDAQTQLETNKGTIRDEIAEIKALDYVKDVLDKSEDDNLDQKVEDGSKHKNKGLKRMANLFGAAYTIAVHSVIKSFLDELEER